MADDGSLVFKVEADASQAQAEINRLEKKIESLKARIRDAEASKLPWLEQSRELAARLDEAKARLFEMENAGQGVYSTEQINAQRETVRSLQSQWESVDRTVAGYGRTIDKANAEIAGAESRAGALQGQLIGAGQAGEEAGQEAAEGISTASSAIQKLEKRIVGLAKRVFIFSVITRALRAVRTWFTNVIKADEQASAAFAQLKHALLLLAQPLMNVIIPALTTVANFLTRVAYTLAYLMSKLFGTSIADSEAAVAAYEKEAAAISGVGRAAKAATKQMAGFDEVQILAEEHLTGGSGGGAGTSVGKLAAFDFSGDDVKKTLLESAAIGALILAAKNLLPWISRLTGGYKQKNNALGQQTAQTALETSAVTNLSSVFSLLPGLVGAILLAYGALGQKNKEVTDSFVSAEPQVVNAAETASQGVVAAADATREGIAAVNAGILADTEDTVDAVNSALASGVVEADSIVTTGAERAAQDVHGILEAGTQANVTVIDRGNQAIKQTTADVKQKIVADVQEATTHTEGSVAKATKNSEENISVFTAVTKHLLDAFGHSTISTFAVIGSSWAMSIYKSLNNSATNVKEWFSGVWSRIKELAKTATMNPITGELGWMEKLMLGTGGAAALSGFNFVVPALAQGAVIPPNREFLAVLGDQKRGTNIEAPLETIVAAFRQVVGEGLGGNKTIVLQLNEREFGRVVLDTYNAESRRVGVQLGGRS